METVTDFFWGLQNLLQMVTSAKKLKDACSLKKSCDNPGQHIKKQRPDFATKGPSSQSYGFSSSHVWMWELDHKESWAPKNWWFWTVVLKKTLVSPLDSKKVQPINPKGSQSWIFIERTDAEAEAPILWPPDAKNWLIRKEPDAGERLKAGGEGYNRGWDGWMASLTSWIWVWASSRNWWRTGKPAALQSLGSQRVRHSVSASEVKKNYLLSRSWVGSYLFSFGYLLFLVHKSVKLAVPDRTSKRETTEWLVSALAWLD